MKFSMGKCTLCYGFGYRQVYQAGRVERVFCDCLAGQKNKEKIEDLRTRSSVDWPLNWYLYVLQCNDGTLYTGITTDVFRRLNEHNISPKGAKYTKTRRPVKLVYWIDLKDRSTAQKAEYKFKKLTREQKEKIISEADYYKT